MRVVEQGPGERDATGEVVEGADERVVRASGPGRFVPAGRDAAVRLRHRVGEGGERMRASACSPTCQSPVPALVTETRSACPARCTRSRKTTSAIGERQM